MSLTLVIGGTRSGKSRRAEEIAAATGRPVRYIATAQASDPEMARRIAQHALRRPAHWRVVEADDALADALARLDGECVLLDGLGAWIAGAMHRAGLFDAHGEEDLLERTRERVLEEVERLGRTGGQTVVVAEHAGEGVLPPDGGSRAWLDLLGEAVQRLSLRAERVELVVAGRVLPLARPDPLARPSRAEEVALRVEDPRGDLRVEGPREDPLRVHGDREVRPGDADHAVNVMAGGPPEWLLRELLGTLAEEVDSYPSEEAACRAVALCHEREPEEVLPTNGAAEALWLLGPALRPDLAACVHPAFTEAEAGLRAHGVPVARVLADPESGFALDPLAVPARADLVVLANPSSPSGTLHPATAILALRRPGRIVVVDEAFMDLVPGQPGSLAGERLEDVIVVRSLTKSLSIPGLRAGYALAGRKLTAALRAVRPPWSANALALAALVAAARRPDALAALAARAEAEREDLHRRLAAIPGVRCWAGAANFCLIEVGDGPAVLAGLRARGIAVRPAASFPGLGEGHLRLTARDPEGNERLAAALAEAVAPDDGGVAAR